MEEERRRLLIEQEEQMSQEKSTDLHNGYYNWEDEQGFRFRGTAVDIPLPRPAPPPHPVDQDDEDRTTKQSNVNDQSIVYDANDQSIVYDADSLAGTSMTTNPNIRAILLKREFVRMSREADEHVRFVAHILSSMSENAIFAYLGLFLFSSQYKWDGILCSIGVTSCVISRALMVICASKFIWYMHIFRQSYNVASNQHDGPCIDEGGSGLAGEDIDPLTTPISKSARALSNYKVQIVLILAGLRGAVSLALVETVPIYNAVTGVGTKNKKLLKAMTSSAIVFTIFVLGGSAYFILTWLDISSDEMLIKNNKKRRRHSRHLSFYRDLTCGGRGEAEMELTTAPSWRNYPISPMFSGSPRPGSRPGTPRPGISRDYSNDATLPMSSSLPMNRTQSELSTSSTGLNRCLSMDNKNTMQHDETGRSSPASGQLC